MATGFYFGVGNIAKKCRKGYIGIDGVARKIKKMYIGVNNIARIFFKSNRKIVYIGNTPQTLSWTRRSGGAGANVTGENGSYAIFAGGAIHTAVYHYVDAFDSSLVRYSVPQLPKTSFNLGGVSFKDYALFMGGQLEVNKANSRNDFAVAYDSALTRTSLSPLYNSKYSAVAVAIGDYALYAGGYTGIYTNYSDVYNSSLTKMNNVYLSQTKGNLGGASTDEYAFLGGGWYTTGNICTMEAFDKSLTLYQVGTIGTGDPYQYQASRMASVGKFAIIGNTHMSGSQTVAFDNSFTKYELDNPPNVVGVGATVSTGDYAIFAGGNPTTDSLCAYDDSLTRTDYVMGIQRYGASAATVDNYVLIAGGMKIIYNDWGNFLDTVEVFQLQ